MIKKIVLIGLLLIAASIAVLFIGGTLVLNSASLISNQLSNINASIAPGNFSYVHLVAQNASFFVFLAKLSSNANFYVFNQSGFSTWTNGISTARVSGLSYAISLENKGAFIIYRNASVPTAPSLVASDPTLLFTYNSLQPYPAGTYYFVVDNTNGSASFQKQIGAEFIYTQPINNQSINSGTLGSIPKNLFNNELIVGGIFFFLLIAGILVSLYGTFKKPPEETGDHQKGAKSTVSGSKIDQKYLDELYKGIGKKKRAKKDT